VQSNSDQYESSHKDVNDMEDFGLEISEEQGASQNYQHGKTGGNPDYLDCVEKSVESTRLRPLGMRISKVSRDREFGTIEKTLSNKVYQGVGHSVGDCCVACHLM
jgi:hypothetical protein